MGWRVGIELTRGYGAVQSHEVATGNGDSAGSSRQSYHPCGFRLIVNTQSGRS